MQPAPVTVTQATQKPKLPKPATYDGVRNVEAINEWTRNVSQYCAYYNLNLEDSLQTAAMFTMKDASTWWHYYSTGVHSGTLPGFRNWEDFVKRLTDAFAPKNHQRTIEDEFHYLMQKTSVKTYAYHFR